MYVETNGYQPPEEEEAVPHPKPDSGSKPEDDDDRPVQPDEPSLKGGLARSPRILIGIVSSLVVLGLVGVAIALLNRLTLEPSGVPSSPSPGPIAQKPEAIAAVDQALQELQQQEAVLTQARSRHILAVAKAKAARQKTSIEGELNELLRVQTQQVYHVLANGQLSGNARDIAMGRSLLGDSKATLLAIQSLHQTASQPSSIRLGKAASLMDQIGPPPPRK